MRRRSTRGAPAARARCSFRRPTSAGRASSSASASSSCTRRACRCPRSRCCSAPRSTPSTWSSSWRARACRSSSAAASASSRRRTSRTWSRTCAWWRTRATRCRGTGSCCCSRGSGRSSPARWSSGSRSRRPRASVRWRSSPGRAARAAVALGTRPPARGVPRDARPARAPVALVQQVVDHYRPVLERVHRDDAPKRLRDLEQFVSARRALPGARRRCSPTWRSSRRATRSAT